VASRYPDDWRDIPVEEAAAATYEARKVIDFVRNVLVDVDIRE